jgi:protein ImuB
VQWIALYLPNLPLDALTRSLATPEPQAVAEHSAANHQRVVACDGKARARGVRPGIAVAAARALAHDLVVRPRDAAEETEALLGLAGWAAQFTPSVALDLPAALALEVSGSLKLFGGADRIRARLLAGCARMGFAVRAACAPTARGAAWLARAGAEQCIERADALEFALAALPLEVAVRDPAMLDALHAIGAQTVGELERLPRDGLARRFGQALLDDLDRAHGRLADPRAFHVPPPRFHARLELPAEATQAESLLFAAQRLFLQLEGFLAARVGGVRQLELRLYHREAPATVIAIGLVAPSRDASHFTQLARERLGVTALPEPVRALALAADDLVPLPGTPRALFDDGRGRPEDWPRLVERLRARLGAGSVHGVRVAEEHRPEYASQSCTLAPAPARATGGNAGTGLRPFWLLEAPRPLAEVGAVPHHGGPLKLLAGPERIESGWWDGAEIARDYFVAQTPEQALVWIYRTRGGGWFLHGLFA